jgi:hypothetical protein
MGKRDRGRVRGSEGPWVKYCEFVIQGRNRREEGYGTTYEVWRQRYSTHYCTTPSTLPVTLFSLLCGPSSLPIGVGLSLSIVSSTYQTPSTADLQQVYYPFQQPDYTKVHYSKSSPNVSIPNTRQSPSSKHFHFPPTRHGGSQ